MPRATIAPRTKVVDIKFPEKKQYFLFIKGLSPWAGDYEDDCLAYDKKQAENIFYYRFKYRKQAGDEYEAQWRETIKKSIL